jgi:undecaprenyl-diphosphatase
MEPTMQLSLWDILLLAVVQGFTEFLPVSSSGHLVVLSGLIASGDPRELDVADLNVVLHIGTLFSIVVFYWQRIWRLLGEDRRVIRLLIVGTIPAVVFGLAIKLTFEELIENALLAGLMLPITGLMLLWAARHMQGKREYAELTDGQAFVIGLSQSAAILPGLSRSGTTICAGLKLGLSPQSAATFSFLLAIPAIAGAGLLTTISLATKTGIQTPWQHLVLGGVVSFVVGLFALHWLIRWLERGRLQLFAWWCIPLGICVTLWQLSLYLG